MKKQYMHIYEKVNAISESSKVKHRDHSKHASDLQCSLSCTRGQMADDKIEKFSVI